ncbi:MAG: nuclear transport factor 2 family protein [Saprospiraceae bacterium]|nr:nuclear transport factor 2 family protein [Saprospiraceae bacterium]
MYTDCKLLHIFCLIISGLFSPINAWSQASDSTSIEQAIEKYIIGWRNADSTLLREAFDLNAGIVLWVDKKGEEERLKSMSLADLMDRGKPQPGYGVGYTIQNLQIIDAQLALAVVKIPIKDSHYIDCLELQKINGDWKIALKSFVYFPKR